MNATLADPPRRVPSPVRVKLLLGGVSSIIGWLLLLAGSVFAWLFSSMAESPFASYGATAPGVIHHVEQTSAKENSRRVYRVEYHFTPPGPTALHGASYTTSPPRELPTAVTVEYDPDEPRSSRVVGMRARHFGAWVIPLVLLFPLISVGFTVFGFLRGRRSLRLLADGRVARGRLVEKKQTMVRVNNRHVFALTFAFETERGEHHRATARTHRPEVLEDDAEELLLYDPRAPSRATLLDHLPGKPRVDLEGKLVSTSRVPPWLYLAMPVACVLTNLVFLLMW